MLRWHGRGRGRYGSRSGARSIEVARANLPAEILTVQADAEHLPFARDSFDLVMSIGVLHLVADAGRVLRRIVRLVRPGGHLHVYA